VKSFLLYPLLFLILFLFAGFTAAAQDDVTSKFIDSLKNPPPQARDSPVVQVDSASASDQNEETSSADETLPDTAIISHQRKISSDTLSRIKKDKGFYYQRWLDSLLRADEANMKKEREPRDFDLSGLNTFFTIFKIILWLLAAAVLVFIIYKLFLGKNALFTSNRKNIEAVITLDEQPSAEQYTQLVKKAEAGKDYRLAVRYRYLQALSDLAGKEYIVLGTEKTNYQYISELRKRAGKAAGLFSGLTLKYEYCWYGEYPVNEELYTALRRDFTDFYKEIV
jgi:nuclear transport factor 2 (NTF2) superfamily protein